MEGNPEPSESHRQVMAFHYRLNDACSPKTFSAFRSVRPAYVNTLASAYVIKWKLSLWHLIKFQAGKFGNDLHAYWIQQGNFILINLHRQSLGFGVGAFWMTLCCWEGFRIVRNIVMCFWGQIAIKYIVVAVVPPWTMVWVHVSECSNRVTS